MQSEALALSYAGDETYKGVVYVLTLNKETHEHREYKCYVNDLEKKLVQWGVYEKTNMHIYITKNLFKNYAGREDNLFSCNNLVVDIDYKDKSVSTTYKYTVMHSLALLINTELEAQNLPLPCIVHYTGNGLQLGWAFEQVSSKLIWPYKITLARYCEEIKKIIKKHGEFSCVKVDDTSNNNIVGYRRLFDTYNPEAKKVAHAVVQKSEVYKLQVLIDAVKQNGRLEFPKEVKVKQQNKTTSTVHISQWNSFTIQNRKRMTLIEQLIVARDAPAGCETRNNYLFIYYNCARGVYSAEMAQKKARNLNLLFKEPLKKLDYIFREIDKRYEENDIYFFKNVTLIEGWFFLTEEEQERYNFKPASIGDFKEVQRKKQEEREAKREQRKQRDLRIISLYLGGMTQAEVAIEVGCCERTVRNIIKKNNISRKQAKIEQIQALKAEGCTQMKASKTLDIPYRTVQRYWNLELWDRNDRKP